MKSRISVDYVDVLGFGCEPVIKIDLNGDDDPRDKLIRSLIQGCHNNIKVNYGNSNNQIFLMNPKTRMFTLREMIWFVTQATGNEYMGPEYDYLSDDQLIEEIKKLIK